MVYILIATIAIWSGDPEHEERTDAARGTTESVALDGFWPTPKMMESLLLRWADEIATQYDLNDDQSKRIQEVILSRWPKFLNDRRSILQPLINEHFELRLALEPPDPSEVQDWAERALSLFDEVQAQFEETRLQLRDHLDPVQQARFDLDAMKMGVGLEVFKAKLKAWRRGEFKEHEWWDPTPRVRRSRGAGKEKPSASKESETFAPTQAKMKIDEEFLRWNLYVAEFIEQFHLDDAQSEAARSILRECKQRALDHHDRYRARLEQLEKDLAGDKQPTEQQQQEMLALYEPIDAIFTELKTRLEQIPTTTQSTTGPEATPTPESHRNGD